MRIPSLPSLLGTALALALASVPQTGLAGLISGIGTSAFPGSSTGSIGPVGGGANVAPNNDNATVASPNVVPYSIFFNSPGSLDVEFIVDASGGTTEYRFTQSLVNNSGIPWNGFLFELGFGLGSQFVAASPSGGLDFDTPERDPAPSSPALPLLVHSENTLTWTGAIVPSIGTAQFAFALDVPDNLQNANPSGTNRFTLRQTPIVAAAVPEPSTAWLLVAALFGLAWSRGRRRPGA